MSGSGRKEQLDQAEERLIQASSLDIKARFLLRFDEVARLCGVSVKTVRRWVDSEGLPVVQIQGAGARPMTFITPRDLDEWIESRRRIRSLDQADSRTVRLNGRRFIRSGSTT